MSIETKFIMIELLFIIDYLLPDGDENVLKELDKFLIVLDGLSLAVSID